ncbi:MAG: hypothetical protein LBS50_05900 [Prevotellaceae bacterium]|nr:hypothetical protein [Prevotellaceae bacterium]
MSNFTTLLIAALRTKRRRSRRAAAINNVVKLDTKPYLNRLLTRLLCLLSGSQSRPSQTDKSTGS